MARRARRLKYAAAAKLELGRRPRPAPRAAIGQNHRSGRTAWGRHCLYRQPRLKSCKKLSDIVLGHDPGGALRQSARVLYPRATLSPNGDEAAVFVSEKPRARTAHEDKFS